MEGAEEEVGAEEGVGERGERKMPRDSSLKILRWEEQMGQGKEPSGRMRETPRTYERVERREKGRTWERFGRRERGRTWEQFGRRERGQTLE